MQVHIITHAGISTVILKHSNVSKSDNSTIRQKLLT